METIFIILRRFFAVFFAAILAMSPVAAAAEKYTLTRIGQDLYEDQSTNAVIRTQFCFEYVYWAPSVLVGDTLVFNNGNTCKAVSIYR